MEVTGEAESTKDALQLIRNTSPDLAIVDITLKGSSGLELIKNMMPVFIGLRVLVLSMHEESLYAERALRAGASGYITKHQTTLFAGCFFGWNRELSCGGTDAISNRNFLLLIGSPPDNRRSLGDPANNCLDWYGRPV
jgi:PleD family two-component response regulator